MFGLGAVVRTVYADMAYNPTHGNRNVYADYEYDMGRWFIVRNIRFWGSERGD